MAGHEGWLTVVEAAGYLKVSRDLIYRMAERGDMPATKLGRQWRFRRDWLDDWLTAKRRGPAGVPSAGGSGDPPLHKAGGFSVVRDAAPAAVATPLLAPPPWRLALDEFLQGIRREYGPRLRRVILYGSRARGDAGKDSDIDVLVVLDDVEDYWQELQRIGQVSHEVSFKYEELLCALPARERDYVEGLTPFHANVRREGREMV